MSRSDATNDDNEDSPSSFFFVIIRVDSNISHQPKFTQRPQCDLSAPATTYVGALFAFPLL
jgi:hypothetical protein